MQQMHTYGAAVSKGIMHGEELGVIALQIAHFGASVRWIQNALL